MDLLSITIAVTGLATTAFQIVQHLNAITARSKERLKLLTEVANLWPSITSLQALVAPDGVGPDKPMFPKSLLSLFEPDGIMKDIESQIQELDEKLKRKSIHSKIRQSLAWPFDKADVLQAIERIHQLQQTLHLALTQSNYTLTQEIYRSGQGVKTAIDES